MHYGNILCFSNLGTFLVSFKALYQSVDNLKTQILLFIASLVSQPFKHEM